MSTYQTPVLHCTDGLPVGQAISLPPSALIEPAAFTVPSALPKYTGPPLSPRPTATPPLFWTACTTGLNCPTVVLTTEFTASMRMSQSSPVNDPDVQTTPPTKLALAPTTARL